MNFSLLAILSILLVHFVADFILQSDAQAKGKSSSWTFLLGHTFMYSMFWAIFMCFLVSITALHVPYTAFLLIPITFVAHTITDYITSREVKIFFERKDFHNGFIVIGFDQVLHYVQLFLTWYYFVKV